MPLAGLAEDEKVENRVRKVMNPCYRGRGNLRLHFTMDGKAILKYIGRNKHVIPTHLSNI